jgi:nucleoside-diphosphate-sugar epimerase
MELSSARVVVTGGAGFLGRRVVARIDELARHVALAVGFTGSIVR